MDSEEIKNQVYDLYVNKKMALRNIKQKLHMRSERIREILSDLNVPIRNSYEGAKLAYEQSRGEVIETEVIPDSTHMKPLFIDKKVGEFNWRETLNLMEQSQQLHDANKWSQESCKIKLEVDRPIAIVLSADWHLGSTAVNYAVWKKDIETFMNTPNLYLGTVGDLIDNFRDFKSKFPIVNQLISPNIQYDLLQGIFVDMVDNGKLLFAVAGNHDVEFDERIMGDSFVARFTSRLVPFFDGKGVVELTVGEVTYSFLVMHKSRFSSFLNTLHGNKREYQLTFPADVVVTAHTHMPGFEEYHHYDWANALGYNVGGTSFLVKCGTYKEGDIYSRRYFNKGIISTPTIVLYPNSKKMVYFQCAEDAITFMKNL